MIPQLYLSTRQPSDKVPPVNRSPEIVVFVLELHRRAASLAETTQPLQRVSAQR
jgi:hypothetical protein